MEQAAGAFQSTFAPAPASDLRRSVCREVLQQSRIAAMQAAEIAKNGARAAMRSARTLADEAALSFARGAIERIASNWRAAASEWAEKASGLTTSWAAQRAAVVDAWTSPMMDRAAAAATAEAVASIAIEATGGEKRSSPWSMNGLEMLSFTPTIGQRVMQLRQQISTMACVTSSGWSSARTCTRFSAIRRQSRRPWQLARRETSLGRRKRRGTPSERRQMRP